MNRTCRASLPVWAALAAAIVVACDSKPAEKAPPAPAPSPAQTPDPATIEVETYTLRGQIEELPDAKDPRLDLVIRHEAIPNFRGPNEERGMDSMSMPFPVKKGVKLDGLNVGDKVEFTFELLYNVKSKSPQDYAVMAIHKLPAETVLTFGPVKK